MNQEKKLAQYELVSIEDKNYNTELENFDFSGSVDAVQLSKDLHETMKALGGAGLAANQLGLPHRVAVFATNPTPLTMYNPKIVYYNDEYKVDAEGCLSHPHLSIKIRRPSVVRVRYQDENGQMKADTFNGFLAKVVQHEVDHLNGIDFMDRASDFHLKEARRKMKLHIRKLKKMRLI